MITANDYHVISGTVTAPRLGAWYAYLETSAPLVTGDSVTLSDGERDLEGTVQEGGAAVSRSSVRIVGGKGQTRKMVASKHWRGTTVGQVAEAICRDAGEELASDISGAVKSASLPFWSTNHQTLGTALTEVAETGNWVWRVARDGKIWIGDPTQCEDIEDRLIISPFPETDSYLIGPEDLGVWVGTCQQKRAVMRVEYTISKENNRAEYWLT